MRECRQAHPDALYIGVGGTFDVSGAATIGVGYIEACRAPNTLRGYRSDWSEFTTWCTHHRLQPLPAGATTISAPSAVPARLPVSDPRCRVWRTVKRGSCHHGTHGEDDW